MKNIIVYDVDAKRLKAISDKYDIDISEVIEIMLDNIDESEEDYIFK